VNRKRVAKIAPYLLAGSNKKENKRLSVKWPFIDAAATSGLAGLGDQARFAARPMASK
jgi:hypothetical protein